MERAAKTALDILRDIAEEQDTADGKKVLRGIANTLEQEIARLRTVFRVNMLRISPETSHDEISRILDGV